MPPIICVICKNPKVDTDLFAVYSGKGVCYSCVNDQAGALLGVEMKEMQEIIAAALVGRDVEAVMKSAQERLRNAGNPNA